MFKILSITIKRIRSEHNWRGRRMVGYRIVEYSRSVSIYEDGVWCLANPSPVSERAVSAVDAASKRAMRALTPQCGTSSSCTRHPGESKSMPLTRWKLDLGRLHEHLPKEACKDDDGRGGHRWRANRLVGRAYFTRTARRDLDDLHAVPPYISEDGTNIDPAVLRPGVQYQARTSSCIR